MVSMTRIVMVATGGTIASRAVPGGAGPEAARRLAAFVASVG
jgi:L-asparaginase/Glu-tRNA(Gln) amidotransferase subunit D